MKTCHIIKNFWKDRAMTKFDPKCETGKQMPYVNADGRYFMCCWLASEFGIKHLSEFFNDPQWLEHIDLNKVDLQEVEQYYQKVKNSWRTKDCLSLCDFYCGQQNNSHNKVLIKK
jgi:hypothetical protein